jgi:hypothetical protein
MEGGCQGSRPKGERHRGPCRQEGSARPRGSPQRGTEPCARAWPGKADQDWVWLASAGWRRHCDACRPSAGRLAGVWRRGSVNRTPGGARGWRSELGSDGPRASGRVNGSASRGCVRRRVCVWLGWESPRVVDVVPRRGPTAGNMRRWEHEVAREDVCDVIREGQGCLVNVRWHGAVGGREDGGRGRRKESGELYCGGRQRRCVGHAEVEKRRERRVGGQRGRFSRQRSAG